MPSDVTQILIPFGFTSLESEIYTFLLQESPATGYRVAQAIGKAAANTYKAIESLQQKGAVLVEEGSSRLCRAVPSDELLARLTRDFEWRRAEAELMLARLDVGGEDERIYALRSRSQVIERARHMLAATKQVALMSCSAHVVHQLADSLAGCGRAGLDVFVACPEPVGVAGVRFVKSQETPSLDEVRLVTDGSEHLLCLFSKGRDEAVHAIWSRSAYLSICAHRGLAAELAQAGLRATAAEATEGYAKLLRT